MYSQIDEFEILGEAQLEKIVLPERSTDVIPTICFDVGPAQYKSETAVPVFVLTDAVVPNLSAYKKHEFKAVIVFYPRNRIAEGYVTTLLETSSYYTYTQCPAVLFPWSVCVHR